MKNYSYPRVVTSVTALQRSSARPAAEDTTVLFVPIIANKGPEQELVKIHSLEEFRSIFGLDTRMGLTLLNISNWLTAGGTIYAYRLIGKEKDPNDNTKNKAKEAFYTNSKQGENSTLVDLIHIKGKYIGSALNGYKIDLEIIGNRSLLVIIKDKNNVIRERSYIPISSLVDSLNNSPVRLDISEKSEYLKEIYINFEVSTDGDNNNVYNLQYYDGNAVINDILKRNNLVLTGGDDGFTIPAGYDDLYEYALKLFWENQESSSDLRKAIGNPLETPIDLIIDAGYPLEVKKAMIKAISHIDESGEVDAIRPDIRGIFDLGNLALLKSNDIGYLGEDSGLTETLIRTRLFDGVEAYKETSNIFFFAQSTLISEEAYFDEDMTVYPSYFLSKLIPANDLLNGMQFPVAGKRRGEIEGIKKISSNPDPDTKEAWFKARVNYIEKDSRGYYFMSQRTFDGSSEEAYTALSFMNNSRVTCRMVNDLQRLGRDYLFEFNDAVTLANMSAVLNRYVSNWIANRTLSFGNVVVSADPYSDERVNAVLNIKFTGTIEVISIDLILQ